MSKKLTIGMAAYDDFDGVYFSIQSIRMFHQEVMDDLEFIIIDNNPHSQHGKECKNFAQSVKTRDQRESLCQYIPVTDRTSTAVRDETFKNSNTPYTLNMDCHVLIEQGGLKKLIDYYDQNSSTTNLYHGPMYYDALDSNTVVTHMKPEWRAQMFGTWAHDDRGTDIDNDPFEIPMHGMGLFTCRTEAWAGFNPKFKGFGGEEGYIHKKFKLRGDQTICLPFLRWLHRFQRPNGVRYVLTMENKVRNYILGAIENNEPFEPIIDHFTGEGMPQNTIESMIRDIKGENN